MKFGGNNFNYFPENKLTKMANLWQLKCMLMSSGGLGWGRVVPLWKPLALYANQLATGRHYNISC